MGEVMASASASDDDQPVGFLSSNARVLIKLTVTASLCDGLAHVGSSRPTLNVRFLAQ